MDSSSNKFEGKYLGNLGQFFGLDAKIEIDEIDCWLNQSRNINLIINGGEKKINCSQNLSEIIRKYHLDIKTNELKKYSVYEFTDGAKYVTHLIEKKIIQNNPIFDAKKEAYESTIKELTKNNELYITERHLKDKILYLTISESKVSEVITEIIKQVSESNINIKFSREELLKAFKSLPFTHNTSSYLKGNYYLGKQASIFKIYSEARFSIFGNGNLALVKVICDVRCFEEIENDFNKAFCMLNSKSLIDTSENFLVLLESHPDYRKKNKFKYIAINEIDYVNAINIFSEIIKNKPLHVLSYEMRSIAKQRLKDFIGAIEDCTKAIEIDPKYANAFHSRGVAKSNLKDYSGAIEDYTKAINIDPIYTNAFYNRGDAKSDLKDYLGAIKDYTKVIDIDPKDASAYYNRGLAKYDLKDYLGAIKDYTKAIDIGPKDASVYYNRGLAKSEIDDEEGASNDRNIYNYLINKK